MGSNRCRAVEEQGTRGFVCDHAEIKDQSSGGCMDPYVRQGLTVEWMKRIRQASYAALSFDLADGILFWK